MLETQFLNSESEIDAIVTNQGQACSLHQPTGCAAPHHYARLVLKTQFANSESEIDVITTNGRQACSKE